MYDLSVKCYTEERLVSTEQHQDESDLTQHEVYAEDAGDVVMVVTLAPPPGTVPGLYLGSLYVRPCKRSQIDLYSMASEVAITDPESPNNLLF